MNKPTMLLIMDGYGLAAKGKGNAVEKANKPNLDRLWASKPHTSLQASGEFVGLPEGQMGNSEVGHTNMGAGRVVWQELSKITSEIKNGEFFENEELKAAMEHAADGHALHLMGLLSDGGVHSHITHLYALLDMAKRYNLSEVYVHAILDGRDVPPACAEEYISALENKMKEIGCGRIASVAGRFYTMDRDKRWERVEKSYDCYTIGSTERHAESASELMKIARANGENDEFVISGNVTEDGVPIGLIEDGDSFIFYNFRPDRAREITRSFVDPDFDGFERKQRVNNLFYVCFTTYDATIQGVRIAFKPQSLKNTLGEYISGLGLKQLRIAETEKYAHVTFFFNGGLEAPYDGEERILIASPKVATYDLQPEMSAFEVTERVLPRIKDGSLDLIIMNLANCDMVGHTGVFDAAVKAVETVDACVGKIAEAIEEAGGNLLITADHGNADYMLDEAGNVVTAHSTNPVPLILVSPQKKELKEGGALCDLAPTLLDLMGIPVPDEMEGNSLLQ